MPTESDRLKRGGYSMSIPARPVQMAEAKPAKPPIEASAAV